MSQVPGPFGSGGACLIQQEGPSEPETIWARGTELFVRHQLDVLRFETNAGIRVFWAADNDIVDIFFNEDRLRRDLPHGGCAERDQDDALIEAAVVQTAVTQARESNKRIFVSFHLVDRGVESFFDARVDALVDPDPTTPPNIASWETNVTVQCQER